MTTTDATPPPLPKPPLTPAGLLATIVSVVVRMASALLRYLLSIVLGVGVIALIGYCLTDHKDYPGKTEFDQADGTITTNSGGPGHGNTDQAAAAASRFASMMLRRETAAFSGGADNPMWTHGYFVTYCRQNPDSVAFIVHVPELKSYKEPATRDALATLAWTTANEVVKDFPFATDAPTVIVGLRGFASYGPIWSGKLGGKPILRTDDMDEKPRLYPFFVPRN